MNFIHASLFNLVNHFFLIAVLFLFVFGVPFSFLPVNSSKFIFFFLASLTFIYLFQRRIFFNLNQGFLSFFSFLLLMSFWSLIVTISHGAYDYSVSYAYMIFAVESLLGSYLLYLLFLKKYSFHQVLHFFIVISFLQALIIILMFVFEPFRETIFSITESKEDLMERYGGFRGFGLAGSVTYDLAVFLSFSLIFISYISVEVKRKISYFYILAWSAIAVAVLMTGRTGWLGIFFSLLILALNIPFRKVAVKSLSKITFSVAVSLFLLIHTFSIYSAELYQVVFDKVIPYALEMFINFSETGAFSTTSSDILAGMYFDVSQSTWLIGDGFWKNPAGFGYYMAVDAGYMRHLLFYGFFFSLLLYIFYLLGFALIFNSLPKTANNYLLIGLLFSFYFIAHYKGDFLLGSSMSIKLFAILLVYGIYKTYEKNTLYR